MAAHKNEDRAAREARDRLRAYQARQSVHAHDVRRRKRDNWIAAGVIVVLVGAAIGIQLAVNPLAPSPEAGPSPSPSPSDSSAVPSKDLAEDRTWTGDMVINGDALGVELDGAAAPQAVSSFLSLSQNDFYNDLSCHRLVNNPGTDGAAGFHVLQCGDPAGNGTGGPGYSFGPIENAPEDEFYPAGTIAMARSGNDAASNGSQFFIVFADTRIPNDQAGGYTVMGKITTGLDALNANVTGMETTTSADGATDVPVSPITIESITLK